MAKAKYTNNGNIKVTMSEEQYVAIRAILDKVVLGDANIMTRAISDLVVDLADRSDLEDSLGMDDWISETCDSLKINLEAESDEIMWSIQFGNIAAK
jgi:hypothetical protein